MNDLIGKKIINVVCRGTINMQTQAKTELFMNSTIYDVCQPVELASTHPENAREKASTVRR